MNVKTMSIAFLLFLPFISIAQVQSLNVEQVVKMALENNKGLQAEAQKIQQSKQLVGSAIDINKTNIYYSFDQNNLAENGLPLKVFGLNQTLQFPSIYGVQHKIEKQKVDLSSQQYNINERLLTKEVHQAYYNIVYYNNLVKQNMYLDSLYAQFAQAAKRKYDKGETNLLEKLTAETKQKEISIALSQAKEDVVKSFTVLNQWVQSDLLFSIDENVLPKLHLTELNVSSHPGLAYFNAIENITNSTLSLEKQRLLPDLQFSVFHGTNGINSKSYNGFEVGLGVPLWFGSQASKIRAAKTEKLIVSNEYDNYKIQLEAKYNGLLSDLKKYEETITYYENTGKMLSNELTSNASKAYKNGEIDFLQFVQFLESAKNIEINYLINLNKYNNTILELNFLTN